MAAIPITSMTSNLPPSPSRTTTPVTRPPTSPQFFSAPPVMIRDQQPQQPYRTSSPTLPSRPSQNDILKRIVKADDGIKKKSNHHHNHHHHSLPINKGISRATIVPPPPLSKYKRPPPIIPHRPGDRYPLGIP